MVKVPTIALEVVCAVMDALDLNIGNVLVRLLGSALSIR